MSPTIRSRATCWRHAPARDMPQRASDGYVAATFDSFAASFESKLAKLSYRAPRLVAAMLEDAAGPPAEAVGRARRGLRDRIVRAAGRPVRAHADRRRSLGEDAGAGPREAGLRRVRADGTDGLPAEPARTRSTRSSQPTRSSISVISRRSDRGRVGGASSRRTAGVYAGARRGGLGSGLPSRDARAVHARGALRRAAAVRPGLTPEIAYADLRMESGVPVRGARRAREEGRQ